MTSWARVQFERKQINATLVRCKNSVHAKRKVRVQKRDDRRLQEAE